MFYNAMKRKGFEPQEEEMRTVVAIHNTVNERTWREILTWEKEYPECLNGLKLVRFGGRPDEPTAKARFYGAMGYKPPFDRHDWVVERCGKEVRGRRACPPGLPPTSGSGCAWLSLVPPCTMPPLPPPLTSPQHLSHPRPNYSSPPTLERQ